MDTIEFYGDTLEIIKMGDGQPGLVARRLVENLGLSWSTQLQKLGDNRFRCVHINTPDPQGRMQDTLILPRSRVVAYLYSINPSKVREDLRENWKSIKMNAQMFSMPTGTTEGYLTHVSLRMMLLGHTTHLPERSV